MKITYTWYAEQSCKLYNSLNIKPPHGGFTISILYNKLTKIFMDMSFASSSEVFYKLIKHFKNEWQAECSSTVNRLWTEP